MLISFLFLHENICCGNPLEVPRGGASNGYPQHMFSWRNKKDIMWIHPLICSYVIGPSLFLRPNKNVFRISLPYLIFLVEPSILFSCFLALKKKKKKKIDVTGIKYLYYNIYAKYLDK